MLSQTVKRTMLCAIFTDAETDSACNSFMCACVYVCVCMYVCVCVCVCVRVSALAAVIHVPDHELKVHCPVIKSSYMYSGFDIVSSWLGLL